MRLEEHATAGWGSGLYLVCALLVAFGRAMDLLSTWIATPSLTLEANPVARWLGWRGGIAVNLMAAAFLALFPVAAISVATTSVLVAARNLQSAWLTRVVGEHEYRHWLAARYREGRKGVFVICLAMNAGLTALVGAGLMIWSDRALVPFAVGLGILTYAAAVAFFTGMAMRRAARQTQETARSGRPF
jgi:hypothetical protein